MATEQDRCPSFRYPPLEQDSIRLLKLLPSGPGSEIQLELVNDIPYTQGKVEYTALSYCWGDPKDVVPAVVNGSPFKITRSLNEALLAIKEHHTDTVGTYLWADAICIDQRNEQEKGRQVSQMWRIFKTAQLVLAWLGPEDETWAPEGFFSWVNNAGRQLRAGPEALSKSGNLASVGTRSFLPLPDIDPFYERRYFSRVWMVTECVQASELVFACGRYSCTWDDSESVARGSAAPVRARRWHHEMPANPDSTQDASILEQMQRCVYLYSEGHCTDVRDRVFAMLGHPLIRQLDPQIQLKADYSLSNDELYVVTLSWIDMLCGHLANHLGRSLSFYADLCVICLQKGLELPAEARNNFESFLTSRSGWKRSSDSAQLLLSNGRIVSCSGPVMQYLIKESGQMSPYMEDL